MQTWRAWSDVSEPITLAAAVVQHCFATKLECQQYMVAFLSLQSLQLLVFCDRGSVLAPLLFNIYISDLPTTVSRKYAYVDDLAFMHADGDWQAVDGILNKDMAIVGEYLQTWKLMLSTTKTVSAVFHLNNKEQWANLMAAQHLPRDLVRSSSGFNNSLKRRSFLQSDSRCRRYVSVLSSVQCYSQVFALRAGQDLVIPVDF